MIADFCRMDGMPQSDEDNNCDQKSRRADNWGWLVDPNHARMVKDRKEARINLLIRIWSKAIWFAHAPQYNPGGSV